MDRNTITQIAFETMGMKKTHPYREIGHAFYHGERVAKLALNLRKRLFPDDPGKDEVIYAGALFHDVAKGDEPHNEAGAALTQDLLRDHCTESELADIARIIHFHNQRGQAEADFVKLVQDADTLDHQGTPNLWLLFVITAFKEESLPHALDYWIENEKGQPDKVVLNYDLSWQIWRERRDYYETVLERLIREANGEII